jgi:hypothetical protein
MSIGSISAAPVTPDTARLAGEPNARAGKAEPAATRSIADHVAAADEHEPIRSGSTTQGTLVDTYL